MKISNILFAFAIISTLLISSCRDTKTEATDDHGHEHNADGSHMDGENVKQEEFQVESDSLEMKVETHTHHNGDEHHDH
jgi:hypothetical protein